MPSNRYLPKLTLPTFTGDQLQWLSFWDASKCAVHDHPALPAIQKFSYLIAHLREGAAATIQGLSITSANYAKAVDILTKRYGQPEKAINAHMKALLDLPPPSEDYYSLRRFHDCIESYIRGLESLGKSEDSFGDLLVPVLTEKLPPSFKLHITRQHGSPNWNLKDLRAAIENEVNIMEVAISLQEATPFPSYSAPTTAAFLTNANRPHGRKCAYYSYAHSSNTCDVVTSHEARMDIAKTKKLCFNCLGPHVSFR